MFVYSCYCKLGRIARTRTFRLNEIYSLSEYTLLKKSRIRNPSRHLFRSASVRQLTAIASDSVIPVSRVVVCGGTELCRRNCYEYTIRADLGSISNERETIICLFTKVLWKIWDFCLIVLRVIELTFIFVPLIILYPITRISVKSKNVWYKLLLFDLEFCGPIFVKLGQWASTRRDLFPEELCSYLSKLQRKAKAHSWFYTKHSLERAFGSQWKHIFVKFDNNKEPIGSGCCAQVYKVWVDPELIAAYGGHNGCNVPSEVSMLVEGMEMLGVSRFLGTRDEELDEISKQLELERKLCNSKKKELIPVAVKVRHPRMETLLWRDLYIMKVAASTVTWIFPSLKWLSLVDCIEDFSQLMKAQVDLCVEARNLEKFASNFDGINSVQFPKPLWPLTTPYLLVETYEEGESMQHYVVSKSEKKVNTRLAEIGFNTILKMVFEDNFAHGDLHPGNILVREKETSDTKAWTFGNILPFSTKLTFPVSIVILDCGIIASLDDRGKECLKDVFTAVINGDGEKVGELFLHHSNHQCADPKRFKHRMSEIVSSALAKGVRLDRNLPTPRSYVKEERGL
ncbi:uncharacterized aarF domain-containing protein kinase 2-like isoform X2 [Periplaneta americana]|uniref:uncharacterized aarF domain-containing protein kinase 2-like isoform X2 n=1 Tax=Periplaneta americana TaxID=6978 RepID=UPI0037E982D4